MKKTKKVSLKDAIRKILANEDSMTFERLSEDLKAQAIAAPFSERELMRLADYLKAALCDYPEHAKKLSCVDDTDLLLLARELSPIHSVLPAQDDLYAKEDFRTQAIKRRRVERYAKLHRLDPQRAAQIYKDPPAVWHPFARCVLPLIAALAAALLPVWLANGSLFLSILLILPLFEGFRYAMDQIFLHFGQVYYFPTLSLEPDEMPPLLLLWSGEISNARALCDRMEQSYLSDHTGNTLFALLLDGKDARSPELLSDYTGLAAAKSEIERLREQYGDHFALFSRKRVYCPERGMFVGADRDMGIAESVARLCGGECTDLELLIGDTERLRAQKYLLILPQNGQIPFGMLTKLCGILAHPQNQPVFEKDRVVKGYGGLCVKGEILHGPGETPFSALTVQNPGSALCLSIDLLCKICRDKPLRFFERDRLAIGYTEQVRIYVSAPSSPIDYFRQIALSARESFISLRGGAFLRCGMLTKGRLLHRILRDLIYPISLFAILFGMLAARGEETRVVLSALSAFLLPVLPVLICSGRSFFRRFFTMILPKFWQTFVAMLFRVTSLPFSALCAVIGMVRGLHPRKKKSKYTRRAIYLLLTPVETALGVLLLAFGKSAILRILGLAWILFPAFLVVVGRRRENPTAGRAELNRVRAYAAATWQYFEAFAEPDGSLPPLSVCISPYPGRADAGSPATLGLTLAATLAAHDLGRIDCHTLIERIDVLTGVLEKIPKKHGLPYARCKIDGSDVDGDPILSAKECGILAICLICTVSGLESLNLRSETETRRRDQIVSRLQKVRQAMDFTTLAHGRLPCLVSIRSARDEQADPPLCDRYASPEMLCVLAGVAAGQLSPDYLTYPKADLVEHGGYLGVRSAYGGLDEYLLTSAFLPVIKGTLAYEAALFALSTQIRTAKRKGFPIFGSGDGGCFAFSADESRSPILTHGGDPELADLPADPDALHPYVSFLALPFLPRRAIANLRVMEQMGALGAYGFYDAVDFNKGRVGASFAIPEVYRTAHQALILIFAANLLCDRPFEKRLLSDPAIASCLPLLQRKMPDTVGPEGRRKNSAPAPESGEADAQSHPSPLRPLTLCAVGGELSAILSDAGHFQLRRAGRPINRFCFDPRSAGDLCESLRLYACLSDRGFSPLRGNLIYNENQAFYTLEDPGIVCRTAIRVEDGRSGQALPVLTLHLQCDGGAGSLAAGLFLCFLDPDGEGSVESLPGMNLIVFHTKDGYLGIGSPAEEPKIDLCTDSRVLPLGYTDADLRAALGSPKPIFEHPTENLLFGMVRILTRRREVTFRIAVGNSRESLLSVFRTLAGVRDTGLPPIPNPDPAAEWLLSECLFSSADPGAVCLVPASDLPKEKLIPFLEAAKGLNGRGFPLNLTLVCEDMDAYRRFSRDILSYPNALARLRDPKHPLSARAIGAEDSITEICMDRIAVSRSDCAPSKRTAFELCPYGNDRFITLLSPCGMGCSYLGEGIGNPLSLPPFGALGGFFGERLFYRTKDGRTVDLPASSEDCRFTDGYADYRLREPFEGWLRIGCDPALPLKLILCEGCPAQSLELFILPFGRESADRDIRITRDADTTFFLRDTDNQAIFVSKYPLDEGVGILFGAFSRDNQREYYEIREKYRTKEDFLSAFAEYAQNGRIYDALLVENGLPDPEFVRRTILWSKLHSPQDITAFRFLLLYDPGQFRERLILCLSGLPASDGYPPSALKLCAAAGRYLHTTEDREFLDMTLPYRDSPYRESVYLHLVRILESAQRDERYREAVTLLSPYLPADSFPDAEKSWIMPTPASYPRAPENIGAYADYLPALIEGALGLRVYPDRFSLSPIPPRHPLAFRLNFGDAHYSVKLSAGEENSIRLDKEIVNNFIFFQNGQHFLEITVAKFKKKV